MLTSVHPFVFGEIVRTTGLEVPEKFSVRLQSPERRRKTLKGNGEWVFRHRVGRSQNNEAIGRVFIPDLLMGKGVAGSSSLKIDVRRDDRFEPMSPFSFSERTGAIRVKKIAFYLAFQSARILLVTLSGKGSFPVGGFPKAFYLLSPRIFKAIPLQKEVLVQLADDFLDLLREKEFPELSHVLRLDVPNGMISVETGDDKIDGWRQKERLFGDILGVLQADQGLPRHLNREGIDVSQLGIIHPAAEIEIAKSRRPIPLLTSPLKGEEHSVPALLQGRDGAHVSG
jgi:hypothetical protein